MTLRRRILWIDGLAALVAGMLVLLASGWLSPWYGLPKRLLLFIGAVNVLYGSYSTPLAARAVRPLKLIELLAGANLSWAIVCLVLATVYREASSVFGSAHLLGEALFVGTLGCLEWRWRRHLQTR